MSIKETAEAYLSALSERVKAARKHLTIGTFKFCITAGLIIFVAILSYHDGELRTRKNADAEIASLRHDLDREREAANKNKSRADRLSTQNTALSKKVKDYEAHVKKHKDRACVAAPREPWGMLRIR